MAMEHHIPWTIYIDRAVLLKGSLVSDQNPVVEARFLLLLFHVLLRSTRITLTASRMLWHQT